MFEECFQVKRICVKPGAVLSLESHQHPSEHWYVVQGSAKVMIHAQSKSHLLRSDGLWPVGAIHRLEKPSKELLMLIEVQIGNYFGKDGIIRYEYLDARN